MNRSLVPFLVAIVLCGIPASAIGNAPARASYVAIDEMRSRQDEEMWRPLREARESKQHAFLMWVAAGVGLVSLLAWRIGQRSQRAVGAFHVGAMVVITFDFALAAVTGYSLLGPDGWLGFFLAIVFYWLPIPHLIAVVLVLKGSTSDGGISRARVFFAGLGLLTFLLFPLFVEIDRGWSLEDIWTPAPERLSGRVHSEFL